MVEIKFNTVKEMTVNATEFVKNESSKGFVVVRLDVVTDNGDNAAVELFFDGRDDAYSLTDAIETALAAPRRIG